MNLKITAGLVLFNPDLEKLSLNLEHVAFQTDYLICVDNGSENFAEIKKLLNYYENIRYIRNAENMGIAFALNQIFRNSESDWVLTLDQDSVCPQNMLTEYKKYLQIENPAMLCPRINDENNPTDNPNPAETEKIENPEDIITSGALISKAAFQKVGGFDESFFIDFVDTDFNKKILLAGFLILRVNTVSLSHEIGKITVYKFLFFPEIICTNHNAARRYFMVRNRLVYRKRYEGKAAYRKEVFRLFLGTLKICIFESDKLGKVKAFFRGFWDSRKIG